VRQKRLEHFQSNTLDSIGDVYPREALAILSPPELMRSYICDIAPIRTGYVLGYPVKIYRIQAVPETPEQPLPPHLGNDVEVRVTEDDRFVLGWDVLFEGDVLEHVRAIHLDLKACFEEASLFSTPPNGRT